MTSVSLIFEAGITLLRYRSCSSQQAALGILKVQSLYSISSPDPLEDNSKGESEL